MSYYASIDDNEDIGGDVATIGGWADFRAWAAKVGSTEIMQLAYHGLSEDLQSLSEEINNGLKDKPPSADVEDIAKGLLSIIAKTKDPKSVLTISN